MLTAILHYPQYYAENPGLKSENSGRVIGNSKIAAWLKKDHSHRIVARIMHSRSDSISVVDLSDGLSGLEDMPLSELEDVLDIDLSEPKSSRVTQDTNVSGDQQNNLKKRHADEAAVRSRKSKKVRIADQER